MITPLHVATVGGHPLRFFRSPIGDGAPDFPWHAIDDLHRCLGLNRDARRIFLRKLQGAEWREHLRTVATADGLVTVAPQFIAQDTIDAFITTGHVAASLRREYERAEFAAFKKLTAHLVVGSDAYFAWMRAAMHRGDEHA